MQEKFTKKRQEQETKQETEQNVMTTISFSYSHLPHLPSGYLSL
jgi:hypothetical protein